VSADKGLVSPVKQWRTLLEQFYSPHVCVDGNQHIRLGRGRYSTPAQ